MKTKLLINTRIIDPQNNIDEVGGILIDENGKIKAIGKKVTKDSSTAVFKEDGKEKTVKYTWKALKK